MHTTRNRRAFISVFNKEGIVEFAELLLNNGIDEIVSTGGTMETLEEADRRESCNGEGNSRCTR